MLTTRASSRDAASVGWIFTSMSLSARYPVMVAVPAGSGLLYCGATVTLVVRMSLRSRPAPTSASITACWRSLVWFIALVTSAAVT
ncbi:Uncharacterised protein [Mycobacterium tuberculosis]|nr:Uncharacterised protein [Mycobacterium tuberculosis]CNV48558.1 Uncharacterised protein [Mycobacterium tuberculosis]COZ36180.1 Uncharacterised protein [Mycobacterium tuberculosis]